MKREKIALGINLLQLMLSMKNDNLDRDLIELSYDLKDQFLDMGYTEKDYEKAVKALDKTLNKI